MSSSQDGRQLGQEVRVEDAAMWKGNRGRLKAEWTGPPGLIIVQLEKGTNNQDDETH